MWSSFNIKASSFSFGYICIKGKTREFLASRRNMEIFTTTPAFQPSSFPNKKFHSFSPQTISRGMKKSKRFISFHPLHCQKMYVPGFGEASPEAKAANNLHNFFNYIAVKIVLAQLESYNPEAHKELMDFIDRNSLDDADSFCKQLMRESERHKTLALRILEVRSAYIKKDFEWDNLKKLSFKMVEEANIKLMREYVLETSHIEDGK